MVPADAIEAIRGLANELNKMGKFLKEHALAVEARQQEFEKRMVKESDAGRRGC